MLPATYPCYIIWNRLSITNVKRFTTADGVLEFMRDLRSDDDVETITFKSTGAPNA